MADGHAVMIDSSGPSAQNALLEKERRDLEQYERIILFRDAVLSGKHPTIRLPPGSQTGGLSNSVSKLNHDYFMRNDEVLTVNSGGVNTTSSNLRDGPGAKPSLGSSSTDINPILLEKSEDLVRAELRIQRQRLERALKEEVDQRRGSKQDKGEPLADADLTDVLSKALTLVQATTSASETVDTSLPANNDNASDSFDDNTFYSSRHDTPESHLTSRVQNDSRETPIGNAPEMLAAPLHLDTVPPNHQIDRNQDKQPSDVQSDPDPAAQRPHAQYATGVNHPGPSARFHVPGLDNYIGGAAPQLDNYPSGGAPSGQTSHTNTSAEQSQSEDVALAEHGAGKSNQAKNAHKHLDDAYFHNHPPSPLVRAQDIAPAAPVPHSAQSYLVQESVPHAVQPSAPAAPGPVAALRSGPIAVDSPESSPQSGKGSDKKKGKKKKRKADRQAPEEVTPYIKPEPRSPSPISASFIRPNKRRRQTQNQGNGHEEDEVAIVSNPQPLYEAQPYQSNPAPADYAVQNGQAQRAASTTVITDNRYGREYIDERRFPDDPYARRQPSPTRTIQHAPAAGYAPRPAPQVAPDDGFRDPARQYREPYDPYRMSVRPEGDPYLGQIRPAPTRILVDSFGREYIEPPRSAMRQSVAPLPSHGTEIMYERPPPRAMSRHPGQGAYDDRGGVVYARPQSTHPGPRRVVTQPEYAPQEIRDAHPREYSVYPAGPSAPFMPVMMHQERRPGPEGSLEYGSRAASTRPVEHVRYGMHRDPGQHQGPRPEPTSRDYDGSMAVEGRREIPQPYVMEYGSRPIEQPVYHRGYSVRPVEGYYDQQPIQQAIQQPSRAGDDISFIERPRGATQEIVYADDARREIYR